MSDDTFSDDHELANAYLDGQVDADERARVEASPELLALVASYQGLRARVSAVPPPSDEVRERAVAAALAAVPAVLPPSNVVSLQQRRWSKALTAAAAVALLGVAGLAVSKLVTGSGDDPSTGAAPHVADVEAGNKQATTAGGAALNPEATSGAEDSLAGGASETTASASGGGAPDTTAAGAANTTGAPVVSTIDGGASAVPALTDTSQLRSLPAPTAPVVPNFAFDCPLQASQVIEAEITWRSRSAVVVRDTVSNVITVLSPECTELASVQP